MSRRSDKNQLLVQARLQAGFDTLTAAAKKMNVDLVRLCALECGTKPAKGKRGEWTPTALKVSSFYGIPPHELWPTLGREPADRSFHLLRRFDRPLTASAHDLLEEKTAIGFLANALTILSTRELFILQQHFEDSRMQSAIANEINVSRARVWKIKEEVVEKLRAHFHDRPHIREMILDALNNGVFG